MTHRALIEFEASTSPILELITKFGGQPVWFDKPQWPLSRETGNPMCFIAQIALDPELFPNCEGQVAYLFMTQEDEYIDGTWEADGGENCLVIQPSSVPLPVPFTDIVNGPTLQEMVSLPGKPRLTPVEREYAVKLTYGEDPPPIAEAERSGWDLNQSQKYAQARSGNKIGGSPFFLQGEEYPEGGEWQLLLQLDSTSVPFFINFGDGGAGYAFIDRTGQVGKFLWQGL